MPNPTRIQRPGHLEWVRLGDITVNLSAQRRFRTAHAKKILAELDLRKIGMPNLSRHEDGTIHCADGQHRIWALREHYGDDAQMQFWCVDDQSEKDDAEQFLGLNDYKQVNALDRFAAAITAGRPTESDINRIVRSLGLTVSASFGVKGGLTCVKTLENIYRQQGAANLSATLRAIRDSYGDGGYEAQIVYAVSAVMARYSIPAEEMTVALAGVRLGSKGLIQNANAWRERVGCTPAEAHASAVVDAINKGRRGKKRLPSWFAEDAA